MRGPATLSVLYYATMLSHFENPMTRPTIETAGPMYDVLKLNPRFAPALVQLAMTTAREVATSMR